MGGQFSRHLSARDKKYLSGHTAVVLRDFASHLHPQLCAALLEREQVHMGLRDTPRTQFVLPQPEVLPGGEVLLEGAVLQYFNGSWRWRHLQVTTAFAVNGRDSNEVCESHLQSRTDLVLASSQICTSVQEHRNLVDAACQHITGGPMPLWSCPTPFPVFVQHPYRLPQCVCTSSREAQLLWARVLQGALQRHSMVLYGGDSPESSAVLEAVRLCGRDWGGSHCGAVLMGTQEEVLASLVMEDVLPYLRDQAFPRKIVPQRQRRLTWMKFLAAAYDQVCAQVRAEVTAVMAMWAQQRPLLEKRLRVDLQEITALQDSISRRMAEDLCAELSLCVSRDVAPLLLPTIQVVATPTCSGFSAARQLFLEACEDVVARSSSRASLQELLSPLHQLSLGSASISQFLVLLEWGSGGLAWLQSNWGICAVSCRPLVLRAQNALQQLVDTAAQTFTRVFSRQFNPSLDPLHISTTAQRVRDHLLKQLDYDLRTVQYQLILECVVQLCLPRLLQGLGQQDLSRYEQLVYSDYTPFLHPHVLYHRVLTRCLTTEIQQVMNHTLPQHCIPLPVTGLPEHSYKDWPSPGGDSRPCSRLSRSSTPWSSIDSYENILD